MKEIEVKNIKSNNAQAKLLKNHEKVLYKKIKVCSPTEVASILLKVG